MVDEQSVERQLKQLRTWNLVVGIILGIQAAREIEPLDYDLAEMLFAVSEHAKQM